MNLSTDLEQLPFDEEEYSCFFNTYVTPEGDLCFTCGWGDSEEDFHNFSTLMSKMTSGKIVPLALKNLRDQCSDADKIESLDSLMLDLLTNDNGPLIPPTQALP